MSWYVNPLFSGLATNPMKTILPPDDKGILLHVVLDCYVEQKILSRPESELRRIFETKGIEGGGLIITSYKQDPDQRDSSPLN
jgi:hypothetical protein